MGRKVQAQALVASDGFSARYDLDRISGVFSRPEHKLAGQSYQGRFLLDAAKGGVATAWMLYEMTARSVVPAALVLNRVNPIMVQGAALAGFTMISGFEPDITKASPERRHGGVDPPESVHSSAFFDRTVLAMPYSDYRPDLMGSAALEPSGAFEAGSYQSFTLTYTAGAFGVDDTGSLKIGFRFATDFGPVQFDDPKGQGYTTVEASNGACSNANGNSSATSAPGAVRSISASSSISCARRHHHHPVRRSPLGFAGHSAANLLRERIRVSCFGRPDRDLRLCTAVAKPKDCDRAGAAGAVARGAADLGPSGRTVPACHQSRRQVGQSLKSSLMRASIWKARLSFEGLPKVLRFERGKFSAIVEGLRATGTGDLTVSVRNQTGDELCRSNPLRVAAADAEFVHFWADTHGRRMKRSVPTRRGNISNSGATRLSLT